MKILLIFPDIQNADYADFAPLGILYIASVLRKNGHQVQVIDNLVEKNSDAALIEKKKKFSPQLIGISCNTLQVNETYRLARLLKCVDSKVIVGGPQATIMFEEMLNDTDEIDFCVLGEGEETIIELVEFINKGSSNLEDVKGIAFRKNRTVLRTMARPFINNIDTIPFPAYDLVDLKKYKSFPVVSMLTSRGCPFECVFCSNAVFGRTNRQRSISTILEEIEFLVEKYDCKAIDFHDDTFNLNRNRAYFLAEALITKGLNNRLNWSCEARVNRNLIDKSLVEKFKESGCRLISFGIESGSIEILKNIKKGIKKEEVRVAVKLCKDARINTRAFFMIGNLGENIYDIFKSIRFAMELVCSAVQFTICTPFPGSHFYSIAKDKDWIKVSDYSCYNEKNAIIGNENLSRSDLIALKNVADFLMLLKGNNLEIFATSLLMQNKKTMRIKKDIAVKVFKRIPQVHHIIKSVFLLVRYLFWKFYYKNNED